MTAETRLTLALQSAGLRLTPQRQAVCRYLAGTNEHPTPQRIYDGLRMEFPSLSLATVYNTLETLVQLGAITSLGAAGDDSIHYDADTEPHINLACTACQRIIDVPDHRLGDAGREAAEAAGFRLLGARLLFYGLCPECQQKSVEGYRLEG